MVPKPKIIYTYHNNSLFYIIDINNANIYKKNDKYLHV